MIWNLVPDQAAKSERQSVPVLDQQVCSSPAKILTPESSLELLEQTGFVPVTNAAAYKRHLAQNAVYIAPAVASPGVKDS